MKSQAIPSFDLWDKVIPPSHLVERDDFILKLCQNKTVIHLGATDYPFTEDKAKCGSLLHQKLANVSSNLIGIDMDLDSINLLKNKYGITNIISHDLSTTEAAPVERADVVVCADIIEHVNSPFNLMEHCKSMCKPNGIIVISTINSFGAKPFIRNLMHREAVHPDHVAWYSFSTLGSLASRSSLTAKSVAFFKYAEMSFLNMIIFNLIHSVFPQSSDGIIMVFSNSTTSQSLAQ